MMSLEKTVSATASSASSSASSSNALNASRSDISEEKAFLLGISEQLARRYTSLLDTIEEFVDQNHVQDINARIDRAKGELNLSALKQLHALRKNFKVGSMLHDYKDISTKLSKLTQEIKAYYESLTVDVDPLDEFACQRCSVTFNYLKEIESCAVDGKKLSAVLRKRVSSLDSHRSITLLGEIHAALDKISRSRHVDDDDLDTDNIQEETCPSLGLSDQLTSRYILLLDTLEEFRDQDVVQSIKCSHGKGQSGTKEEPESRKSHAQSSRSSSNLTKLTQDLASYYNSLVEDLDNVDELKAHRCSITVKYLKDMQQSCDKEDNGAGEAEAGGSVDKLAILLRRRLAPRYNDSLVFPDRMKRIDWANVRVDTTTSGSS